MKIILEDYTIECSIEEYEILLNEGYLYKETLDNMKKVFFEPKKEVNFTKVSMKKQTFDEDDTEFYIDENIKSIPKRKSDVDTKLNNDYFDDDFDGDSDEDKQMKTTKEVVAKDKEHLKVLIKEAVDKYGKNCDLNFIDVSNVTDMSWMFAYSEFNGDISKWNVGNVTDMSEMFYDSKFNKDISEWNVSNVENMNLMFKKCPIEESNKPKAFQKLRGLITLKKGLTMKDKPLKITEYISEGDGKVSTKIILLLKVKDTEKWKFVNLTKGHVCPCEFASQEEALKDFLKYFDKFYKVIFEEFNPNRHIM